MKELITYKDIQKSIGLTKFRFFGKIIAKFLMIILKINDINKLYSLIKNKKNKNFFEFLLKKNKIKVIFHQEDLKRIPTEGPFIVISNHPLGALDGIIMLNFFSSVRKDFKIVGNFLLKRIEPITDYIIPINPFHNYKDSFNNLKGIREFLDHLNNGGCLGIFPAGEVSNMKYKFGSIQDNQWIRSSVALIKKAKVPIIPMYFHAKNSNIFYFFGKIHPVLQTALLPYEMLKKRIKPIQFKIGKLITVKQLQKFTNILDCSDFLRRKVYLHKFYYKKNITNLKILKKNINKKIHDIIDETAKEKIIEEINFLKIKKKDFLFSTKKYQVFFTKSINIPNILKEIGRLREISFRLIGEGSNKSLDIDIFDNHYEHLFLWDIKREKIIGSYRIAFGSKIYNEMGVKGFYTNSLFNFSKNFHPFLKKTIEIGRAFVRPQYQQKTLPLFLLWKGILHICIKNPYYKYLMGGVSISNKFSDFSKSLIIQFIRSYYFDPFIAQYVKPNFEYKIKLKKNEKLMFIDQISKDLNKLNKIIEDIEPNLKFPVMIKKYFKQNAKVVAFNIDPLFNNVIDGLMYIRISEIPKKTINPIINELKN